MKILDTLRLDHAAMQDLLDEVIEQTTDDDIELELVPPTQSWRQALQQLRASMIAHDRAEEAVFYETLRMIPNRRELADLKTEEHHMAEELLAELLRMTPDDREWRLKLEMLKTQIEAHIAEEETSVFGVAGSFLTDEVSESLGKEFDHMRADIHSTLVEHPRPRVRRTPRPRASGPGLSRH